MSAHSVGVDGVHVHSGRQGADISRETRGVPVSRPQLRGTGGFDASHESVEALFAFRTGRWGEVSADYPENVGSSLVTSPNIETELVADVLRIYGVRKCGPPTLIAPPITKVHDTNMTDNAFDS